MTGNEIALITLAAVLVLAGSVLFFVRGRS
jgi:hypothetical protein